MKRLIVLLSTLLLPLLAGCAHNYYNIPQTTVTEKVRVLGVVPIILDEESDIAFPQREDLLPLLVTMNRSYERNLVRLIKETDTFYTVTLLDEDPKQLFSQLFLRRERRDDASVQYNKYFWKEEVLADLLKKHHLDAVMLVVVSGITKPDRVYSSNLLEYLSTDYNFLVMTAQILDGSGVLLWEYPNFRQHSVSYKSLLNLQYPDFDEAKHNQSPKVIVKFKSLDGIRRALEKRRLDWLRRETPDADLYTTQFEEMADKLELDRENKPKQPAAAEQAK